MDFFGEDPLGVCTVAERVYNAPVNTAICVEALAKYYVIY